jgi:hypothetical protein
MVLNKKNFTARLLPKARDVNDVVEWGLRGYHRRDAIYFLAGGFGQDFIIDESEKSYTLHLPPIMSRYHGATYVPQPDPVVDELAHLHWVGLGPVHEQSRESRARTEALRLSPTFEPIDLALDSITATQKQWSIVWTSNLHDHLGIQDFKIFVYWCPTTMFHKLK